MKMKPRQAASMRVWRQVVVLPLCVFLIAVSSAPAAKKEVLSVSAAETKQLHKLLLHKRIDALLEDGTHLRGRVKVVKDGLLTVHIKKSTGPSSVRRGQLQNIPMERISTVQFVRHKGNSRALRGAGLSAVGLLLGVLVQGQVNESSLTGGSVAAWGGVWGGMTVFGVLWGMKKDRRNVTLTIKQRANQAGR